MQQRSTFHLPSLGQFMVSALGFLGLVCGSAVLLGLGVFNIMTVGLEDPSTTVIFASLWAAALAALLNLPSMLLAGMRLAGKTLTLPRLPRIRGMLAGNILLLAWLAVLLLGEVIARQTALAWLILPPLQILAVALPVGFFLFSGLRGLRLGSAQRNWGLVSFGITLSQPIIIVLEGVVILFVLLTATAWLSSQPGVLEELERLAMRLMSAQANPQALENIIMPYLQNPMVIFGSVVVSAGLIPLVEELFKPMALWAIMGKRLTPREGFVGGMICGAIFALVESLGMMSSASAEGWALSAVGRMGTAILHITTTSLTGWGLATAWQDKRFGKLGAACLISIFFHGVWNTFGLLTGWASLAPAGSFAVLLAGIAPVVLAFLALELYVLLMIGNRLLLQPAGQVLDAQEPEEMMSKGL